MRTEPLDRLTGADPLPDGSSAPPLDEILARIAAEESPRARGGSRRRAWAGALVPVLGAAAALAVAAVVLLTVSARHGSRAQRAPATHGHVRGPGAFAGGMRGLVFVNSAVTEADGSALLSLEQCLGCREGNPRAHSRYTEWLMPGRSAGGGGASRVGFSLTNASLAGANGWAEGLQATSSRNGGGMVRFYVSHDGGRHWHVAPSAAPAMGEQPVSLGGGEAWAIGVPCPGGKCSVVVLHGPVGASRLVATGAQPVTGSWTNVEVVPAGPGSAFVTNPDAGSATWVTHDDGRSWRRVSSPCPGVGFSRLVSDGASGAAWISCQPRNGPTIVKRTNDGGRTWMQAAGRFASVLRLQPVSATAAWALTVNGTVLRTVDGGASWQTVWSPNRQAAFLRSRTPHIARAASMTPVLTAHSVTSAGMVTLLTQGHEAGQARRTDLVVWSTSDGGETWGARVVRLPAG